MQDVQDAPPPEEGLAEPVLVPPQGLWAVALALFALTAVLALLWAPSLKPDAQPSLALEVWRETDVASLRQPDDALLRMANTDPQRQALEATLLARFRDYLQREATLGARTSADPDAREVLGALEEDARTLATQYGTDALRRLAVQFGRDVHAALDKSMAAARAAHQPFAQHVQVQPMPADVSELTAVAGGLATTLARTGIDRFARSGSLDPAAGQVVETIAQVRFLQLGVRLPKGPPPVPSDAWFLVQRFRVEAHVGLDMRRRLALLDELAKTDPAYPVDYARGVLLAREQSYAEAERYFARAATHGPLARQARENARWCRDRARRASEEAQ